MPILSPLIDMFNNRLSTQTSLDSAMRFPEEILAVRSIINQCEMRKIFTDRDNRDGTPEKGVEYERTILRNFHKI